MAQYGGDQYGRDVRQTDEYGNPVSRTDEYETIVHSATGGRYERDVRHTDEFGNTVHITEELATNPLHPVTRGTGAGGYGIAGHQGLGTNLGHVTGDYASGGRSTGQTGYLGLGADRPGGAMADYGSTGQHQHQHHQGLGQGNRGTGTDSYGSTGHQGLGAKIGQAIGGTGTDYASGGCPGQTGHQGMTTEHDATQGETLRDHVSAGHHHGLGDANKGARTGTNTGTDYTSSDRSVGQTGHIGLGTDSGHVTGTGTGTDYISGGRCTGQTGHKGLGTEIGSAGTTVSSQKLHTATPMGGAGVGTGTKDVPPYTGTRGSSTLEDTHEKKGMMQKIKEKLPGGHSSDEQQTTGGGYGDTHEKKGMMEKIKEKLPGHH